MKTVIVYDVNSLESLMTAAIICSIRQVTSCDCRSFLPEADHYVWIDVVPTKHYFFNFTTLDFKNIKNTVIANIRTTAGLKAMSVPNTEYIYSQEKDTFIKPEPIVSVCKSYGERSLLERALIFFKETPDNFAPLLHVLDWFYIPTVNIELIQLMVLNAKKAELSLRNKENSFTPIFLTDKNIPLAEEAYFILDEKTKVILKDRWKYNWIKVTNSGNPCSVYTFFETDFWWFIKRRLIWKSLAVRNISTSATGTIVRIPGDKRIDFETNTTDPVVLF